MAMTSKTPQLYPLRNGTRQRFQPVGSAAVNPGNIGTVLFPHVGLLNGINVTVTGTITTDNTYVWSRKLQFSFINRFRLYLNQGTASLYDVSGWHTFLLARSLFGSRGGADTVANVQDFPGSGVNTAKAFTLNYFLPISINDGHQFDIGMVNLQAPEITANLDISFAALAALPGVTAVNATAYVGYQYYEVPDPRQFAMPQLVAIRWLQDRTPVAASGENIYTLPRMGTLMNLMHEVVINGAASESWDSWKLRFNKTDEPYSIIRQQQRARELYRYGLTPETGVVNVDLFNAYGLVNDSDVRDAIDTEEVSTTESVITISSGVTPTSSTSYIDTTRRIMQVLQ